MTAEALMNTAKTKSDKKTPVNCSRSRKVGLMASARNINLQHGSEARPPAGKDKKVKQRTCIASCMVLHYIEII